MNLVSVALTTLAMSVAAWPAKGAKPSACPVPQGGVEVALPSGLPPALRVKMGNIALPGQPFNAIDVYVKGQPNERYIFVWNMRTRWIVATELGGIALRSGIFVYDLGNDGKTANLIDKRIGIPGEVCGAATKLAGK
jgi:hypothetical protein